MSYLTNYSKIKYEGANSKNKFAFHHYNPNEKILGKSMKDHLKFAMS
jgi:xylose isomerase